MTLRCFSKVNCELDTEQSNFQDYWANIGKKIDVNIPYLNWDLVGDVPVFCRPNESTGLLDASILLESK